MSFNKLPGLWEAAPPRQLPARSRRKGALLSIAAVMVLHTQTSYTHGYMINEVGYHQPEPLA